LEWKSKIKKCPYCGSDSGFEVSESCRGRYNAYISFQCNCFGGEYDESMTFGRPTTPRCQDCKRLLGRWIKNEH